MIISSKCLKLDISFFIQCQNCSRTIEVLQDMVNNKNALRAEPAALIESDSSKKKSSNRNSKGRRGGEKLKVGDATETESEEVQMKKLSREFWSLNQAAEVERQRLSELVSLLTQRLKLAEERLTEAETSLREERQRCARAELAAERAHIDLRDSGKLASSVSSRTSSGFRRSLEEDVGKMSVEDLRWEVLRLKEEARAMRRELGEARGAREEMVRIYKQMLEDTRQIYRQNLTES